MSNYYTDRDNWFRIPTTKVFRKANAVCIDRDALDKALNQEKVEGIVIGTLDGKYGPYRLTRDEIKKALANGKARRGTHCRTGKEEIWFDASLFRGNTNGNV